MKYVYPKYQRMYYTESFPTSSGSGANHVAEVRELFKRHLISFSAISMDLGDRLEAHRYGSNMPVGARALVQLAAYLGSLAASPISNTSVLHLLSGKSTVVTLAKNGSWERTQNVSSCPAVLYELLTLAHSMKDPGELAISKKALGPFSSLLRQVLQLSYEGEDSLSGALVTALLTFIKLYSLIFITDAHFTFPIKSLELTRICLDQDYERAFTAYVSSLIAEKLITALLHTLEVDPKDFDVQPFRVLVNDRFFSKLVDSVFDFMTSSFHEYYHALALIPAFKKDRLKYSLMSAVASSAGITTKFDPVLSIGMPLGEIDITQSGADDFVSSFHLTYAEVIPLWMDFINNMFTTDVGYYLPSVSARATVLNGRNTIYQMTFLPPYLRNNFLFEDGGDYVSRVGQLRTAGSSGLFQDDYPCMSLFSPDKCNIVSNLSDTDLNLMRLYATSLQVQRISLENTKYSVSMVTSVHVIVPPANAEIPVTILGARSQLGSKKFDTIQVDYSELTPLDILFHVKPHDIKNIGAIYLARIGIIGKLKTLGYSIYYPPLLDSRRDLFSKAVYYASFGVLPSSMYERLATLHYAVPLQTKSRRVIKVPDQFIVEVPVHESNFIQSEVQSLPKFKIGSVTWYGDASGFAVSYTRFSDLHKDCYTARFVFQIDRDLELSNYEKLTKLTSDSCSFVYSPKIGSLQLPSYREDCSYSLLGAETLFDYCYSGLETDNPLSLAILIPLHIYSLARDGVLQDSSWVQSACAAIKTFLSRINLNEQAMLADTGVLYSDIQWSTFVEFLNSIATMKTDNKTINGDYIKVFTEHLITKSEAWTSLSKISILGVYNDVFQLLMDQFSGVSRFPSLTSVCTNIRYPFVMTCFYDTDSVKRMVLQSINRRLYQAIIYQSVMFGK